VSPVAETAPAHTARPVNSRAEAIDRLREIARYFRAHEPHSPAALLAERAARWAETPLEDWLAEVIKDKAALEKLREQLGILAQSAAG
jgi:type VI secretion system protein ImpA